MNPSELPPPSAEAQAHSHALGELIASEIRSGGPIGFDRYCELALYQPQLGYYAGGSRKFGAEGDFVTAPEVGALFARCLATAVAETLVEIGGGQVLELGAGSGRLACDLLQALEARAMLPEHYAILEVSADLRQRQQVLVQERVPHLVERIQWLDTLPDTPFSGLVLGNEVVDALPARRYRKIGAERWSELRVGLDGDALGWTAVDASAEDQAALAGIEAELAAPLPEGYRSERQPQLGAWAMALAAPLARGRVLLVDYGYPRREYYHPERSDGTLICHYRHRAHGDPFWYPGLNDISVNVEFTALAEALDGAGLSVDGFNSQVQFLLGCGLGSVVGESTEAITRQRIALVREVQTLTAPGEMGERFQVLCASRDLDGTPPGFQSDNRLDRL